MTDIVVGIDGSPGSRAALRWAIDEAHRRRATLRAVLGWRDAEQPRAVQRTADAAAGPHDEGSTALAAKSVLHETVLAVTRGRDIRIIEEVLDVPGAEALLRAGRNAEMIVVGARGRGLLHRLRIGSVSASVAVQSSAPVIIARVTPQDADDLLDETASDPRGVRPGAGETWADTDASTTSTRAATRATRATPTRADQAEKAERTPRPIVVGVDGSANSLAALRWAAQAAALRGCELHVIHAWLTAIPLPFTEVSGEVAQTLEKQAHTVLDDSVDQALTGLPGIEDVVIHRSVVAGSATQALIMRSREADLLVVGARGRGGFAELLLGSVSHQAMLHASAPVAIIRAEDAA